MEAFPLFGSYTGAMFWRSLLGSLEKVPGARLERVTCDLIGFGAPQMDPCVAYNVF